MKLKLSDPVELRLKNASSLCGSEFLTNDSSDKSRALLSTRVIKRSSSVDDILNDFHETLDSNQYLRRLEHFSNSYSSQMAGELSNCLNDNAAVEKPEVDVFSHLNKF